MSASAGYSRDEIAKRHVRAFDQSPVCAEAGPSRRPLSGLVRSPLALKTIQELVHGE